MIIRIDMQYLENYNYDEKKPFTAPYFKWKMGHTYIIQVDNEEEKRAKANAIAFCSHFFGYADGNITQYVCNAEKVSVNEMWHLEQSYLDDNKTPSGVTRLILTDYAKANKEEKDEMEKYKSWEQFGKSINPLQNGLKY